MDWQHIMMAMNGISTVTISMRKPNDWFAVLPGAYIAGSGTKGAPTGNNASPETSVTKLWEVLTTLPETKAVAINGRFLRWNGFMWYDVDDPTPPAVKQTTKQTAKE